MRSILKYVLISVWAGLGCYFSFRTACTPFPSSLLPSPQIVKMEIPERTLVFSDGTVEGLNWGWNRDLRKFVTSEEWYEQARKIDPSIIPAMIFSGGKYVDLMLLQKSGGLSGSSTIAVAYDVPVKGFVDWPWFLHWHISTETIEVDRANGTITYYARGEPGETVILFLLAGVVLFLCCLFFWWNKYREDQVLPPGQERSPKGFTHCRALVSCLIKQ